MASTPISWNEIRTRAAAFVHEWKDESNERAEAQTFWNEFLQIFNVSRRRVASFEEAVKKASGAQGFIDLFWPGLMVAEHKSRGKDLDAAHEQAFDYFPGLEDEQLPRYVLVSDFARFALHDLEEDDRVEFALTDLLDNIEAFGYIAGYEKRSYDEQDPVNVKAAGKMGDLHDKLKEAGYTGHDLEVYLVRLLFCLFADDTGIFAPRGLFQDYLLTRTNEDGSDLGSQLDSLFQVLDTPEDERQANLDEQLEAFPYVNGLLFSEPLRTAHFSSALRRQLLDATELDWGDISPAIFGAMFQGAMDAEARRQLGAHYTSEKNILKLIGPLFLDELRKEFERAKRRSLKELERFHQRLGKLSFLDPACGCGNFLVIAYRELRLLEIEVIKELRRNEPRQRILNIHDLIRVNVDQCFGIESEEFPSQIARVALWLMDHQMNIKVAEAFGEYFTRLPLTQTPHILCGNALRLDWKECFDDAQPKWFNYILGNPPFVGTTYQTNEQKNDLQAVTEGITRAGVLDYVAGWYIRAAQYMNKHADTVTAFVSTNSISQGEQVGILWKELFAVYNAKIHFAHRTFQWRNEASGLAAVHVVIIGFALFDIRTKRLFEYEDIRGEPHERTVSDINPYLVQGNSLVVVKRRAPICNVPQMSKGSQPTDGGNLLLSKKERDELLAAEPQVEKYIRSFVGSREFINNEPRFCLWLVDAQPNELRGMPEVLERIDAVRQMRLASSKKATQKRAKVPAVFTELRQPETDYLLVPSVSSKNRDYIPIGYLTPETIVSNLAFTVPNATRYHFGILSSLMHMTWMRYTAGRLKSDYRYSNTLVYNNFPWPDSPSKKNTNRVKSRANEVIAERELHLKKGATLADLYDPRTMPRGLVKAHQRLDRAADLAYRPQAFTTETNRVSFLFDEYESLTNALFKDV